jgi:uncharacterized membrane protein
MLFAYVGPGAGFTVLGTGLVTLTILLLLIAGFVWYPLTLIRRTIARRGERTRTQNADH